MEARIVGFSQFKESCLMTQTLLKREEVESDKVSRRMIDMMTEHREILRKGSMKIIPGQERRKLSRKSKFIRFKTLEVVKV